ncbi:MAG: PAS domain-containing sensor histidine kinase [Campylobacterales bacterium]|nr:PAS domain-containing sensor histidine kinase [Campylobacterales bacterium]
MAYKKKYTLYFLLSVIVIVVVTTIMSVLLGYNYFDTKDKVLQQLQNNANLTLSRLQKELSPFIESYSVFEYEKLLKNEMKDQNLHGIVLEDFSMGSVTGNKSFQTIILKDKHGNNMVANNNSPYLQTLKNQSYFSTTANITTSNDQKIGQITLYYTDKHTNLELKKLLQKSFLITFIVSIILIITLYFFIKHYLLNPFNLIISSLNDIGDDGLPKKPIPLHDTQELINLSITMNKLIQTVRLSKRELRQLNERFELTLDAVKDGIWDWDLKSDKAFFSKNWKLMLGYGENEIENKWSAFFELIHKDDQAKVKNAIEKHLENHIQNKYALEIRLKAKDGSYKWILSRGEAIFDDTNKPYRMVGYHTDITSEKENQEYLKQQEKIMAENMKLASMGEMIGNIAHQWRQPLSVISTGASGLKLQKEYGLLTDQIFNEICDTIVKNAQYLSRTIDDFRNFIKGDRKQKKFALIDEVKSFLILVEGSMKSYDITVDLQIDETLVMNGFNNELSQCFINIFNNAKDALKQNLKTNRYFKISASVETKDWVTICLHDNAGGINPLILDKIFEPYFTTKHQSQGTGLGLHMTRNLIVEGMKGSIQVFNEEITFNEKSYMGAKFVLTLPIDFDTAN